MPSRWRSRLKFDDVMVGERALAGQLLTFSPAGRAAASDCIAATQCRALNDAPGSVIDHRRPDTCASHSAIEETASAPRRLNEKGLLLAAQAGILRNEIAKRPGGALA